MRRQAIILVTEDEARVITSALFYACEQLQEREEYARKEKERAECSGDENQGEWLRWLGATERVRETREVFARLLTELCTRVTGYPRRGWWGEFMLFLQVRREVRRAGN